MSKSFKKKLVNVYIKRAAKESGRSFKEIEADMFNAKRVLGLRKREYLLKGLYNMPYSEIKKLYGNTHAKTQKTDLDVELVAELKGISYDEAQEEMDKLKIKHDILYKEYTKEKLYKYKTKKGLNKRIERIKEKNEKYLQEVCDDAGWTYEKAKSEASRIKKRYGISYKQYSRYRFYSMSDEEISARLRHWTENTNHYVEQVMQESGWDELRVRRHMKRYSVLYDILQSYYVLYRAWELSDEEMDSYARQKNSETLWSKYNDPEQTRVLADKYLFDEVYKDYTGRKFWVNRNSSFEEFCEFAEGLENLFCKPIESGGGLGTEKYEVTDDLRGLYDNLMGKERLLVEECIKQHPEVDEFIPGCVCTIRVVTLMDGDGVHTICAGMRFGYNSITDNFSHDGMVADIDIESGIIITDAIDKKGNVYEVHPISGKRFKGFEIPNWDMVREVTEKAMHVQDGVNYVGWDVAICEDKAVLVEGNAMPDLVLIQAPYAPVKKGMKYLFTPYMEDK